MFKKSYKGRRIKLAAKKSLAVPVAIVTSFIVILAVSLSTLINKGLVNAFSDSVTPAPSTASTTSESTADLVKSTEISSSKENKANKENVEEKPKFQKSAPRNQEGQGFKKPYAAKSAPSFEKKSPSQAKVNDFDAMMSSFLKDSEDRLTSLKRNTEGKRGGRGGRRS